MARARERLLGCSLDIAVPLVFSVHTMVALDFSQGIVVGMAFEFVRTVLRRRCALFSGFAMTLDARDRAAPRVRARAFDHRTTDHRSTRRNSLLAVGIFVGVLLRR